MGAYSPGVLGWLTEWWDDVELWVAQLWFPFQVTLVLGVLVPVCWVAAWLLDRGVDQVSAVVTRVRDAEPPLGGAFDAGRVERSTPGEGQSIESTAGS